MSAQFNHVFILAAGEGRRMRPFTEHTPKPMAEINGETLIKRAIRQCRAAGIENIIVNSFHLADKLEDHLKDEHVTILREPHLLDTGGSIKNALAHMPDDTPFYCISGDSWWTDSGISVFEQMDRGWRDDADLLLILQNIHTMNVTRGVGDYHFDGRNITRALNKDGTHIWTSHRIIHPRLFNDTPDTPFSFLTLMDKAEQQDALIGLELDGVWQHLTTLDDVAAVNAWLRDKAA